MKTLRNWFYDRCWDMFGCHPGSEYYKEYTLSEHLFMWRMGKLSRLYSKLCALAKMFGWNGLATDLEQKGYEAWERSWLCSRER